MKGKHLILGIAFVATVCAWTMAAQVRSAPATKTGARHAGSSHAGEEDKQDEGERLFARRCSNCHNDPEGFSPRISGTVVRHMRARANLSQHEEEALLRFFNP